MASTLPSPPPSPPLPSPPPSPLPGALHAAARLGDLPLLTQLLSHSSISIDAPHVGKPALLYAASHAQTDALSLLLSHKADVHARAATTGWGAIHTAAERDETHAISLLLSYSANVNEPAHRRVTPLHFAAFNGRLGACVLLVARGGDLHARDAEGYTPLDDARHRASPMCACSRVGEQQWEAVAAFLEKAMAMAEAERLAFAAKAWELLEAADLHDAALQGDTIKIARLLRCCVNVNARDYDGSSAIHSAAEGGHALAVSLLVERGADVHARSHYLDTALHVAASEGHVQVVSTLVVSKADPHAKTKFGVTPLENARRNGHQTVVGVLESLEHGKNHSDYVGNCNIYNRDNERDHHLALGVRARDDSVENRSKENESDQQAGCPYTSTHLLTGGLSTC